MSQQFCEFPASVVSHTAGVKGGFLRLLVTGFLLSVLGVGHASEVPFADNFNGYPRGTVLDGINGWSQSGSGQAIAAAGRARLQSVILTNNFTDGENKVSISFDLQPRFSKTAPPVPAGSTFVFYFNTNGYITAYDGTTPSTLTQITFSDTRSTNCVIDVNYTTARWSLFVGGTKIASNFGFYSDGVSQFRRLGFMDGSTNAYSFVDNVDIRVSTTTLRSLPFLETFEPLDQGDLDGQNLWDAMHAVVQTDETYGGSAKAGGLTNQAAYASQYFDGAETEVWTDLYMQPAFGSDDETVTNPPSDATFAFYVSTNGHIVVYDGTTPTELSNTPLTEGDWVRFTVHSDHVAGAWDLYLNGLTAPIASGLGFYCGSDAGYSEFSVRGAGSEAVVDDINIVLSDPLLTTTTTTTTIVPTTTTTTTVLPLRITGVDRNTMDDKLEMSWEARSGVAYRVWWKDDLLAPWPTDQTVFVTGGFWEDTNSVHVPIRFYRVTTDPAP